MLIKTLVENTSLSKDFVSEHGLSLYIQTKNHKILFDVGASELVSQNAKKLNVDIADIDFLVISHGHNDHGGGLRVFLQENSEAKVYIHRQAFENHYALRSSGKMELIGLDKNLKTEKQIIFTSDRFFIHEGIWLFSNITKKEALPKSNHGLYREQNGTIEKENFAHEQNLVIEEDGKIVLITGCAHNGVVNIVEHFHLLRGRMPNYVIGGFHLSSRSGGDEDFETIDKIGQYLIKPKAKYYTCHCTGIEANKRLKSGMNDSIDFLSTGRTITI